MLCRGTFWLVLLLVPTLSVLLDYVVIYSRLIFKPTPIDIAVEFDRCTIEPRLDQQIINRHCRKRPDNQQSPLEYSVREWMR
jgi:magnesium-transporting ATPase (P-type)